MAEEENATTSSTDDKPFFAIDAEDLAEASVELAAATTPPASSPAPQPPQPMMLGTLSNPSGAVLTAPSSGADGDSNTNPWGAPTPQLTGELTSMGQQGMFSAPMTASEIKEGFRWGQYAIGFFIPIVVLFLIGISDGILSDNYEDPWRYDNLRVQSDDGRTFEIQFEMDEAEVMEGFYSYIQSSDQGAIRISCWHNYYESSQSGIFQYDESSNEEMEIGTYYSSNATAFFQLSDATADWIWLDVDYYNPEIDQYGDSALDALVCFLPLIYIGSIIAAFVRGNKALAYGLLTPAMLWLGLIIAFILFVIAFW